MLQEIYFDLDDSHIQSDSEGLKIAENLLEMTGDRIHIIDIMQNENSFEIKDFYEKWFIVLSGISKCYRKSFSRKGEFYYHTILDSLKRACARWAFYGGCRNFSINFYKNRFKLKDFSKNNIQGDYATGIDRMKKITELKENSDKWAQIASDAEIIRKCYQYLKSEEEKKMHQYFEILESYCSELQKAKENCHSFLEYAQKLCNSSDKDLINRIKHSNNKLYFERYTDGD